MVVVTGGSGLVGKELIAQLLQRGEQVTALFNNTPLPDFHSPLLNQVACNVLDIAGLEAAMEGAEQVYHCAAIVTFNPARKEELFKINVEGTANVVNAAINSGVRKLVHVSSVAALGRIREDGLINETMNWTEESSNSLYGKSKYQAEMEVWRGIGEGLEAVMVNPVIILGNGDWNSGSTHIFRSVYDEFPWYSDGVTGFVDVRDVAAAMIQLMNSSISSERFILSEGNYTYREVFEKIARAFGKKPPHKRITPLLAALVWRLEALKSRFTGKDPLVTRETARTALAKAHFDNSKLPRFLPGFTYHSLDETITHTCRRLQQKLNNG